MRQVRSHLSYRPKWGLGAGLLVAALFALSFAPVASAGTISVTTTFDQLDGSAPCSLREAVDTANADANSGGCTDANPAAADTIKLAGGDYNLQRAGVEDANASGDLDVTESLTIAGAGADLSGIDGNGAITGDRVLHLTSGTLTISGLSVHDGFYRPGGEPGGGGIFGASGTTLRLIDSTVSGSKVESGFGGGIYAAGTATLTNSTVSGNNAGGGGGGMVVLGDGTLTYSSVRRNKAGTEGGGIYAASGSLTVTRSTVSDNDSTNNGGGIFFTSPGTLKVTNSTLSGNESSAWGGALSTDEGTTNLQSATINRNVADADADFQGDGGGLDQFGTATVKLRNTILSGNLDRSSFPENPDWNCNGGVVSEGYNLLSSNAGCAVAPATGDQTAADPGLAFLANNGGKTLTQALLLSSPAVNAGNPATPGSGSGACPSTDQRGVPRSLGGRCDKGAYERVSCHGKLVNRVGTSGADLLVGTSAADGILALGGNDVLRGGSAGDGLCGGEGDDQLFGEAGPDFLDGGGGTDTCNGGTESDQAVGCETISSIP
jgi:CSLREA domain-containing protein